MDLEFTHTPATTYSRPDTYDSDRIDITYQVATDDCAEDPRTGNDPEHTVLYVFRGPRGAREATPEHPVAEAFDHFYQLDCDAQDALTKTRRWIAAYAPQYRRYDLAVQTLQGSSQGHWAEVFAAIDPEYGSAAFHIQQYRYWMLGDIWQVTDGIEPLHGIYADSPEQALAYYLADNPPPVEALVFDDELLEAMATALTDRGDEQAVRWLHTHQDDPLMVGVYPLLDHIQRLARKETP